MFDTKCLKIRCQIAMMVKEILTLDENVPTRIHFIVNGIKSNRLCDSLCTYLDNSTTFATRYTYHQMACILQP